MNSLFENPLIIQLLVFGVVTVSFIAFWSIKTGHDVFIENRVRRLTTPSDLKSQRENKALSSLKAKIPRVADSVFASEGRQRIRLQKRFLEAGIYQPWALPVYVTTSVGLAIGLPAACLTSVHFLGLQLKYALLSSAFAAVLGICLPRLWLERRRTSRHFILRCSLPDFLDLIVACLGGGLSVQAALRQVTDELKLAHPVLSGELGMVIREIEFGGTLDHALNELAIRTGMDELRTLRSFVHQTTKLGTTITDALAQLAEMLRIQREQKAEELAQKAAVKILFPTILFIFPTIFVVLAGPAALQIKKGFVSSSHHQRSSQKP